MSDKLSTLIELGSEERRLEAPKKWKEEGKKVFAWTCTYVPEEIIYAAGILPIRTLGSVKEQPEAAEAYLPMNSCSFCLSCLDLAVKKEYDFLDGVVATNGCDDMRRLYDNWAHFVEKPAYKTILDVPHKENVSARDVFTRRLNTFKQEVEEVAGNPVTDDALREAIALYNKTRGLLRRLSDLRKRDIPPISGTDTMGVVLAGMSMPKEEYNLMLEGVLNELESIEPPADGERQPRLMITGSPLANPAEIKIIEDLGAVVVADDLCTGMRYFRDDIDTEGDPMDAISRRYLERMPCARMLTHKGRQRTEFDVLCLESCPGYGKPVDSVIHDRKLLHDIQTIEDFRVDGVIYTALKFCSPWLYTFPAYRDDLKKTLGTPLLMLQREYAATGLAQMRTRVGAFLEMLE